MSLCYVVSDPVFERLTKEIDPGKSKEICRRLRNKKEEAESAEEILEQKTLTETRRVRQIKVGQWRFACVYVRGIDVAEVIQLNYLYNKNENDEPDPEVLNEIDEAAGALFEDAADWPPAEQSAYLDSVRTRFPDW